MTNFSFDQIFVAPTIVIATTMVYATLIMANAIVIKIGTLNQIAQVIETICSYGHIELPNTYL